MMQDFAKKLDIEILDIPITQHQRLTIYICIYMTTLWKRYSMRYLYEYKTNSNLFFKLHHGNKTLLIAWDNKMSFMSVIC